jgi:hypothetical protein
MSKYEDLERRITALEALEERIRRLEEVEEIKQLHRNYIYWLTNHQWEKVIDCFAEGAVADMPTTGEKKGKRNIEEAFRTQIAGEEAFQKGGHLLAQPVITMEEGKANGYWTMYRFAYDFVSPAGEVVQLFGPQLQGRFDCEYVKEGGAWKFGRMKFARPWPEDKNNDP